MRRLLFLLLSLTIYTVGYAERVTEQQALEKAQQFMQGKSFMQSQKARQLKGTPQVAKDNAFYIFNVEDNGGFVIVSGDDRTKEILGYSERGNLDIANAPSNIKWLLYYYEQVIDSLNVIKAKAQRKVEGSAKNPIPPLIATEWGQNDPYNGLCPNVNGNICVTGCIATAMAQVINYNRWPQGQTSSVEAYQSATYHINMPQLEPTQFNWDNMNASQIARLMLYCGQAVNMNYGPNESGADYNAIAPALTGVFGYSKNTRLLSRNNYEDTEWENLIYDELSAGRPVIYSGQGSSGGHSFVVCGFMDEMFYINWGWYGDCNGYFALSNLSPYSFADYSSDQTAVVGIQPPADASDNSRTKAVVQEMTVSEKNLTRESSDSPFPTVTISSTIESDLSEDATIQIGLGLYDENGLRQVLASQSHDFSGDKYTYETGIIIGKELAEGEYIIKAINRMSDYDEWLADAGASEHYVTISVGETDLNLQTWPKTQEELYYEDFGIHTIDGITYHLFSEYENYRANVLPYKETEKYEGDVYVPDYVNYANIRFEVWGEKGELYYPFTNCPELTSLSVGVGYGFYYSYFSVVNCPKLTSLEIREGTLAFGTIEECGLESITFPSTLTKLLSLPTGKSLKTIKFLTTQEIMISDVRKAWNQEHVPALTDVYFSSAYPPVFNKMEGDLSVNPNITIHIPQGTLDTYKNSIWKDWKLEEDQPAIPSDVYWSYCSNDQPEGGLAVGRGNNAVEFAMNVPASQIMAYQGCKISKIEFFAEQMHSNENHWADVEYVFITKPGTDYLVKVPVNPLRGSWNTITLPEPYSIVGEQLFVGVGRQKVLAFKFASSKVEEEGFYMRVMGNDTSYGMGNELGVWQKHAGNIEWNHPLPIRFYIEGENLPTDVLITDTEFMGDEKQVRVTVQSRVKETINSLKIDWTLDQRENGSQTFETNLLSNHEEDFFVNLPSSIQGHNHILVVNVAEINGEPDEIKANSCDTIAFTIPVLTHFPRKTVMEEGTGTWCGWCVRGIETIDRLKKEYPDNFIAIGVHTGDRMYGAANYEKLFEHFGDLPNSFINRETVSDPSYHDIKKIIENEKDNAEAMITAHAQFVDATSVMVETECTFGFDDPVDADFRIAYVVVEDSVGPYIQQNYYSDPSAEHSDYWLDEWTHKDRQVEMLFNDVARGIYSEYTGTAKSIPSTIKEGEAYKYQYTFTLPDYIQDKKNIRIITLLLDNKNGQIINADQTNVVGDISQVQPYAVLSNDNTTLTFYYDDQKKSRAGMGIVPFRYAAEADWHEHHADITKVIFDKSFTECKDIKSTALWFAGCDQLTTIEGIEYLNTTNVVDMNSMFTGCSSLTSLDLSHFDTSNVTNMNAMFNTCESLKSLDLSHFDTSNVTDMSLMFTCCNSMTSLDLSHFNTQNVADMSFMVQSCNKLESVDISRFDTRNVKNMDYMFSFNRKLTTIYAGKGWDTANVTSGHNMFSNCKKLIGGQGTRYDQNHIDQTYARIDGGESAPGYFTYKPLSGDANGDGTVNAADIVEVVNYIMGHPSEGFDEKAADINSDRVVNAADIVAMVNIILNS